MGRILYMDNYRGFNDTYVCLKDVNFMVGENSSGKSTVIALFKVLLSSQFWGNANINCEKEEINTFDELVNQYSDSHESFTVGIAEVGKKPFYILLRYSRNEEGLPILCGYKSHKDGWSVQIDLNAKSKCNVKKEDATDFTKWVHDDNRYELNDKFDSLVSLPLPFIVRLNIMHHTLESGKNVTDLSEIDVPSKKNASWIEPIRAKAKSIYSSVSRKYSEDGAHIPVVIKNNKDNDMLQKKLREFGRKSDLFDSIEIDSFGSEQSNAPFSIKATYSDVKSSINEVGQGVSQMLPILVECYMHRKGLISIQQPEVHLHPKAQAAFGEVIYEVARAPFNNQILIETHSDYTIDRYRYTVNKKGEKNKKSQILFFVRTKTGNVIKTIEITEDGTFPEKMPKEYGKFFLDEELKMLSI